MDYPDLRTTIGPLRLKNPVITASGTYGYGREYSSIVDVNDLGGIVVKGISLKPRPGNPPPRIVETPCGMLNAIGLANVGIEVFLKEKLPWLQRLDTVVIANIYGHSIEEYGLVAAELRGVEGISAIEVNISCPNVECGGMAFGTDPEFAARVTETVRKNTDKPTIIKLSPNVTDIRVIARAVERAGADILSLTNTLTGMAIDIEKETAQTGKYFGWVVRACHPTCCALYGVPGGSLRKHTGHRDGRYYERKGCPRISHCRGKGRSGGNGQLRRPAGPHAHY